MTTLSPPGALDCLQSALASAKYTAGSTHGFYLYPARFSPDIARAVIAMFSKPGDWLLDPFMGGGTTVIEALALGRFMVGVDLNALAHFVVNVRTRPLSPFDEESIRFWAEECAGRAPSPSATPPAIRNLPLTVARFISGAIAQTADLSAPRQRAFARAVLLRLGQWALDCRDFAAPSRRKLADKLPELTEQMLAGLREFVDACRAVGLRKNEVVGRRLLLCRDAVGLHEEPRLRGLKERPRLVFTSPPYPCVHVLYHRWQVYGRRETPAPYWIAQVPDGYYASHYTGGSRTPTGERNYFAMIRTAFASVRQILASDALVVQLVGFSDVKRQLPLYLATMVEAGFESAVPEGAQDIRLWREVPNRKWHAKLQAAAGASSELLLFHRPSGTPRSLGRH